MWRLLRSQEGVKLASLEVRGGGEVPYALYKVSSPYRDMIFHALAEAEECFETHLVFRVSRAAKLEGTGPE